MTDLQLQVLSAAFEDELEKISFLGGIAKKVMGAGLKKAPKAVPKPPGKFVSGLGPVGRGNQTMMRSAPGWRTAQTGGAASWGVPPNLTKRAMAKLALRRPNMALIRQMRRPKVPKAYGPPGDMTRGFLSYGEAMKQTGGDSKAALELLRRQKQSFSLK